MNMNHFNIVILDFETSGLNPYHDDIIEIGAKVYQSDKTFSTLVIPKSLNPISEKIINITNITNKMLKEQGKEWSKACQDFIEWLLSVFSPHSVNLLVSHNGDSFDFLFFRKMLQDMKKEHHIHMDGIHIQYIDTILLAKRTLPKRYSYSQSSLCKTYQIQNDAEHRAMGDVLALEKLFEKLINNVPDTYHFQFELYNRLLI